MDGSLVFELVWFYGIRPNYLEHKRRCANKLHSILCKTQLGTTIEDNLSGMMEVLEYLSNSILIEYKYATTWYIRDRIDVYYPLSIRGLNIINNELRVHNSNSLGGYRV